MSESPDVDPQFVIQTLFEENRALNENRLYLMALLKQLQAEFLAAKELWDLEKQSLKKTGPVIDIETE